MKIHNLKSTATSFLFQTLNQYFFSLETLLLISVLFASQLVFAQMNHIDSLKLRIDGAPYDSVKMKMLDDLSWELMYNNYEESREAISRYRAMGDSLYPQSDEHYYAYYGRLGNLMLLSTKSDSAEYYYNQALQTKYAQIPRNVSKRLNIQNNLATLHFRRGAFDKAREQFNAVLEYGRDKQDTSSIITGLTNISATYIEQGLLAEAIPSLMEAYEKQEQFSKPTRFLPVIASNLCAIFAETEDCASGEDYCKLAIDLTKGKNNTYFASSSSNWATCLNQRGEYQEARRIAKLSLSVKPSNLSSYFALLAIGDSYKREGKQDSAIVFFEQAVNKVDGMEFSERAATGMVQIADVLYEKGAFERVYEIVQKVIPVFKSSNKRGAYYKRALELNLLTSGKKYSDKLYVQEYKDLSDSLYSTERSIRINEVTEKYESEKKEQENRILVKERDAETKRATLFLRFGIFSAILLSLLAALTWFVRKRNRQLSDSNHQIQTLNTELHHRTKNNFNSIVFLLKNHKKRAEAEKLDVSVANALERQIKAYTKLQEHIKPDQVTVELKAYLKDFCEHLREIFANSGQPVHFNHNLAEVEVKSDFAATLALIINELATNSVKYARREGGVLSISLDAVLEENEELRIFYRDGGPADGEIDPATYSSGQGSALIEDFTEQLEGAIVRYGAKDGYDFEAVFALAA